MNEKKTNLLKIAVPIVAAGALVLASFAGKFLYNRAKEERAKKIAEEEEGSANDSDSSIRVANLFLYPIKCCRGIEMKELQVGPRGFLYDRYWVVVCAVSIFFFWKSEINENLQKD